MKAAKLADIRQTDVPCNGCTRCCEGDAVRLLPGDDFGAYQTEPHPWLPGERMLAHKDNGDCIYLGEAGCTIHERRPQMCREMDCRLIAASMSGRQAHRAGIHSIYRRGRELLRRVQQ